MLCAVFIRAKECAGSAVITAGYSADPTAVCSTYYQARSTSASSSATSTTLNATAANLDTSITTSTRTTFLFMIFVFSPLLSRPKGCYYKGYPTGNRREVGFQVQIFFLRKG